MGRVNRPINASTVLLASNFTALGTPSQFTRASVANYTNQWGILTQAAINAARFNYSQYSGENLVTNPRMEPAPVGNLFNSTNVSGWAMSLASGLTATVVGKGTMSNGAPYLDIRIAGINTSATTLLMQMYPNGFTFTPAIQNDVFTVSAYFQVIAGTIPSNGGNFISPGFDERTGGAHLSYQFGTAGINTTISTSMQRITRTITATQATTDQIQPGWWINCNTIVYDVDVTIRFGGPQVEKSATASVLSLPAPGTFAASINYTGGTGNRLLIEAARTNGIRNPRAEGSTVGIIGSGGVAPTNWAIPNSSALNSRVVGTGIEFGMNYIDVRFDGVASGAGVAQVIFDQSTGIAGTTGQTWSASLYVRVVGGDFTNLGTPLININEYTGGGVFVTFGQAAIATPTATLSRYKFTYTTVGGGTVAAVLPDYRIPINAAAATDVTLRIYGPQMELGNQPTSLILPTAGVPAASTRAVDQWDIPTSSFFKTAGTVQNLALQSQTLENAAWTQLNLTAVTVNAIAAPDGVVTAEKIIGDATNNPHGITQNVAVTAGNYYTFSAFAKLGDATFGIIRLGLVAPNFGSSNTALYVDVTTGTMTGFNQGTGADSSYTIVPLSTGWYRINLTALCTQTGSAAFSINVGNANTFSTLGDAVSGSYLWGVQVETGRYATAYALTTATASTPRTKLAPGTVLVRSQIPYLPVGTDVFGMFFIHSGSTTNRLAMRYHPASINVVLASNNVNIPTGIVMNSAPVANTGYIAAASWDDAGVLACVNGGTVFSTAMPMPTGNTTLTIGQASPGLTVLNGEVRRVSYHPYKMTAAQLQAATV